MEWTGVDRTRMNEVDCTGQWIGLDRTGVDWNKPDKTKKIYQKVDFIGPDWSPDWTILLYCHRTGSGWTGLKTELYYN